MNNIIKWLRFPIEGENRLWTIVFIVYSCFHTFFERVISDYIVEPFLSTFQDTVVSRIIAIFIVCVILMRLYLDYKSKERRLYCSQVYFFSLVFVACFYYRVINTGVWNYVGIFNSDWVAYSDLVPFYCLANIITVLLYDRKPYEPNSENSFYIDNPITKKDEDMLGRTKFAESIARKTLDTQPSDGALTVGIVAPWGFGKTSFINMMKEYFVGKAIVINFSPWIYEDDKNLTQAFFLELNKAMKVYNPSLSEKLISYAELLSSAEVPYMKLLSNLLRQGRKNSLESLRNDLELALKSMKEPIVVIIDDLDRLGATEIMEVMKIIRNSANFSNIRFIATYDREYVTNVLKDSLKPGNYLEKIFQVEYVLPNFDKRKLIAVLKDKLSFVEEKEELNDCFAPHKVAFEELTSLRDVKRFVNMFQLAYRNLQGKVVLIDLMNLIILKQKYTSVYNLLAKKHDYILTNMGKSLVPYNRVRDKNETKTNESNIHKRIDIEADWDSFFKDLYNDEQKYTILNILKRLFRLSHREQIKGINSPWGVERYFHDTLLNEDYPETQFKDLWKWDYSLIVEDIDKNAPIKTKSFFKLMANYKPKNKEEYKKMVKAMLHCGEILYNDFDEYDDVLRVVNNSVNFEDDEHQAFIERVIDEAGASKFVAKFLEYSDYVRIAIRGIPPIINSKKRLNILKTAIEHDFSLNDIYEFLNSTYEYNVFNGNKYLEKTRIPGADKIFIEYAKQHPIHVISDLINGSTFENKEYFEISDFAKDVWGSWDAYEKFLNDIENYDSEKEEYLKFFSLFKANTYKSVPFKFVYIRVNKNNIYHN